MKKISGCTRGGLLWTLGKNSSWNPKFIHGQKFEWTAQESGGDPIPERI